MFLKQNSLFTAIASLKISAFSLVLLVSFFVTLTANVSFYQHLSQVYPLHEHSGFILALFVIIFALNTIILLLTYLVLPLKLAASIMLLLSVVCAYFSDKFGVVIDVEMIRNSLQTNVSEASDLLSLSLVWRLVIFAIIPITLMQLTPIKVAINKRQRLAKLKTISLAFALSIVLIVLSITTVSAQFSSFIRQHKQLRYYINPIQPIYSAGKYISLQFNSGKNQVFKLVASYVHPDTVDPKRELVIMVVGETARADHFGLNGYVRQTTPMLSKEPDLINYPQVRSCGTSTAISVPCMFSVSGRNDFDVDSASNTENVFDIIADANVSVLWRDNNSDSKGVAIRQRFEDFRTAKTNPECDDECRDIGMLSGLQDFIDQQPHDVFIVLHQMGSHGPAYYKRYPKTFEKYTPACQTAELSNCSDQEIINAYDNTILYTDYFLSKVIALLKANNQKFQTSMLYVSDHGESLGENGIYLHGLPYAFAPDSQTHVPMVFWTDKASDIDIQATRLQAQLPNSQDSIAKALVNLFEINTDAPFPPSNDLLKFK